MTTNREAAFARYQAARAAHESLFVEQREASDRETSIYAALIRALATGDVEASALRLAYEAAMATRKAVDLREVAAWEEQHRAFDAWRKMAIGTERAA